jgi:Niemann-Pick C1 protein
MAVIGLICVGVAYLASFGFCSFCGLQVAGIHNLLPFLLLGIGVDDMFVLCAQIEQCPVILSLILFWNS